MWFFEGAGDYRMVECGSVFPRSNLDAIAETRARCELHHNQKTGNCQRLVRCIQSPRRTGTPLGTRCTGMCQVEATNQHCRRYRFLEPVLRPDLPGLQNYYHKRLVNNRIHLIGSLQWSLCWTQHQVGKRSIRPDSSHPQLYRWDKLGSHRRKSNQKAQPDHHQKVE